MATFVLFGLPGAGKTFVGGIFQKYFDHHFFDGDDELPEAMRAAIKNRAIITDTMRNTLYARIIARTRNLQRRYDNIVLAQTFLKEQHRTAFLQAIPEAKFVLVQAADALREARLAARTDYPLNMDYARKMSARFEAPRIAHATINNNAAGAEAIPRQIRLLLRDTHDTLGQLSF